MGTIKFVCGWILLFCLTSQMNAQAASLRDQFRNVNPSVVVIQTSEHEYAKDHSGAVLTSESFGSGVIISSDGLIMTAAHVVNVADTVNVKLLDGRIMKP